MRKLLFTTTLLAGAAAVVCCARSAGHSEPGPVGSSEPSDRHLFGAVLPAQKGTGLPWVLDGASQGTLFNCTDGQAPLQGWDAAGGTPACYPLVTGPTGPTGATGSTGATGPATGAAGGNLSGNYPNPYVVSIDGSACSSPFGGTTNCLPIAAPVSTLGSGTQAPQIGGIETGFLLDSSAPSVVASYYLPDAGVGSMVWIVEVNGFSHANLVDVSDCAFRFTSTYDGGSTQLSSSGAVVTGLACPGSNVYTTNPIGAGVSTTVQAYVDGGWLQVTWAGPADASAEPWGVTVNESVQVAP
jgi:hypothetical protein